jgi:hypothetical protein
MRRGVLEITQQEMNLLISAIDWRFLSKVISDKLKNVYIKLQSFIYSLRNV